MKAEAGGDAGPAIPENPELRAEAAEVLAHGDPALPHAHCLCAGAYRG